MQCSRKMSNPEKFRPARSQPGKYTRGARMCRSTTGEKTNKLLWKEHKSKIIWLNQLHFHSLYSCFPDQVSGPPLLELHGVRSRSRELRRHLISRRHILPPKAEASGFFQRKKTFRNIKITPQVLRYMSENLSQLTGVVKKIKIDLWIPISNFQAHLSFCGWTPVNWSLFSTQTSRSTCQSQR